MKKKLLTTKLLIRRQRYHAQLFAHGIFCLAGCAFTAGQFLVIKELTVASVILLCMNLVFCLGIFGYFLGLRGVLRALKSIRRIQNREFVIRKGVLRDMYAMRQDESDRYCIFCFDTEEIGVPQAEFDKAKIGDEYYFLIFDGEEFASGIFRTKEYELDEALTERMR